MLNSIQAINEVFSMMEEPFDPAGSTDLSHWTRANILIKMNMAQDELQLELPDLFRTTNSTLTTVALQMEYTVPVTIGTIRTVSINGIVLNKTTRETLQGDALRGDLVDATEYVQNWASITGEPYSWYQDQNNTVLGIYPKPVNTGDVIMLEGEYILAEMTDVNSSYAFDNVNALRKAQKILIYKTAEVCAIADGDQNYATYLHQAAEKMIESLRTYWFVLKPTNSTSTIIYKQTEGPTASTLHREIR